MALIVADEPVLVARVLVVRQQELRTQLFVELSAIGLFCHLQELFTRFRIFAQTLALANEFISHHAIHWEQKRYKECGQYFGKCALLRVQHAVKRALPRI